MTMSNGILGGSVVVSIGLKTEETEESPVDADDEDDVDDDDNEE